MKLYIKPFNKNQRGGERFIFSSSLLSKYLTKIFKPIVTDNFSHVNHVFRYNKFKNTDHKFVNHYDTPYYNRNKNQISEYTIVIYLTEGSK